MASDRVYVAMFICAATTVALILGIDVLYLFIDAALAGVDFRLLLEVE